jgi:hypothetical protein
MPLNAAHPNQVDNFTCSGGTPSDLIEVVAFLTAPGTVSISVGATTVSFSAPAGVSSYTMPLTAGTPIFRLIRGTTTVISKVGPVQIYGSAGDPAGTLDFTYWSGSASGTFPPLAISPDTDFLDAPEGLFYTQTRTASGGVLPYVWSATGIPSWASVTISSDTKTWTISGTAPMFTEMDTVVLTLADSS